MKLAVIAVIKECAAEETRVAATPDSVKRFVGAGLSVVVQAGAGLASANADSDYEAAGATIAADSAAALAGADVVLCVRRLAPEASAQLSSGTILVGLLAPHQEQDELRALAAQGVSVFSMELLPRISRAQSMDVLSSQANLAGYKAVIDAAAHFKRAFPMMMTAAGTVAPARVFVLGAGVAGLQAIATARRLGAVVSATDVRATVKEQVESLGASFVMVDSDETARAETSGGYAREMSEDYKRRQAELVAEHLAKQDVVITTALIPGRQAPVLVTAEMVESMKPGSVIVDLAVEQGGNCPLSQPGQVIEHQGISILGYKNVPGRLPIDASNLYARNLFNFLSPFIDADSGTVKLDWDDELVSGTALSRDGEPVHALLTGDNRNAA